MYMFQEEAMELLKPSESLEISLDPFKFELIMVFPMKVSPRNNNNSIQFVPLGLVDTQMTGTLSGADFDAEVAEIRLRWS